MQEIKSKLLLHCCGTPPSTDFRCALKEGQPRQDLIDADFRVEQEGAAVEDIRTSGCILSVSNCSFACSFILTECLKKNGGPKVKANFCKKRSSVLEPPGYFYSNRDCFSLVSQNTWSIIPYWIFQIQRSKIQWQVQVWASMQLLNKGSFIMSKSVPSKYTCYLPAVLGISTTLLESSFIYKVLKCCFIKQYHILTIIALYTVYSV